MNNYSKVQNSNIKSLQRSWFINSCDLLGGAVVAEFVTYEEWTTIKKNVKNKTLSKPCNVYEYSERFQST